MMMEDESRASWERGLVTDARGRRISQLDPVLMNLGRRHDEIPAEALGRIAHEVGLGINRANQILLWSSIACVVCLIAAGSILLVRYYHGTISVGKLLRSLVPYGCIWLAPYGLWKGTRNARFGRITKVMLEFRRCPHCGYDLRGLAKDEADGATVCPECGCGWKLESSIDDGRGDE